MKPTQRITLTWNNLGARVKDTVILQESTGYCKPGDLLAIMGPSGSGKTTLLSLLTYKYDKQMQVQGEVLANNTSYNGQTYYNFGSYVYQNDVLYPTLTVRQTLMFIARLKFATKEAAEERVSQLISEFELQKCADGLIGTEQSKGISGGEKKRVCIAIEMVAKPPLLILDEPTSGLDSNKAARVLKVLKKLANQGHSIIFTIHQPSFLLYSMLNRVIVLNAGEVIYQGEANQVGHYLQSLGIKLSTKSTICDFFMLEISQYKRKKDEYQTPFNKDNYNKTILGAINSEMSSIQSQTVAGYEPLEMTHGFWRMFSTLLGREWTNYKRNPMKITRLVINYLIMAAMICMIFQNSISSTSDIDAAGRSVLPKMEKQTVISKFIQAQSSSYINIISTITIGILFVGLGLPLQRPIFYKEESSKQYTASAYFIAKVFIEVCCLSCGTLIYTSIVFWVLGFDKDFTKYIFFSITIIEISFIGNAIGFFTGSLFKDPKRAASITSVFILPMSMLSGLWNKLNFIPPWISWLQYASPFRYALQMLMENQYQDYIYQNGSITYNYREDLGIDMSWFDNFLIILALATVFYFCSFLLLVKSTRQISA